MTNSFYTATGNPATGATGASATIRAEFLLIQAAFDAVGSLPPTPVAPNTALVANGTGTGYTVTTGTLALAGNFATTGTFSTTLHATADVTLQVPATSGTLALLPGTASRAVVTDASGLLAVAGGNLTLGGNLTTTGSFNTSFTQSASTTLALPGSNGTLALTSDIPTAVATSDLLAGTNSTKYVTVDKLYAAGAPVTVTFAASLTVDLATFINATITLTSNLTLNNPTNIATSVGKSGRIRLVQDGTGSRTLTLGSQWKVSGGAPTLSTAAGAIDHLNYWVVSSTLIECSLAPSIS